MGLLEKAQQRKQVLVTEEVQAKPEKKHKKNVPASGLLAKAQQRKEALVTKEVQAKPEKKHKKNVPASGLLAKAQQRKQRVTTIPSLKKKKQSSKPVKQQKRTLPTTPSAKSQQQVDKPVKQQKTSQELVEERTGFGWEGLGSRAIVFDHECNEYQYMVTEPMLTEEEEETKKELARLFKMLADVDVTNAGKEEKKKYLGDILEQIISDNDIFFEEESKDKIFYHIFRDFIGYGKIDILMEDEGIEDISCDGHHVPLFLHHKKYEAISTNIRFKDEDELDSFVVRLSQICGKQISIYSPIVDGKLPDGSRLQTTLSKTVTKDSTFTIRRFKENPLTPIDLIRFKSLSVDMAAYFWMAIEKGASILFCGGTASGKTTALNALSLFIPSSHKIISIEDTREVSLPHQNWIAGTTRQGFSSSDENKTGKDIDMFDLIRAALRQRPRVVIVGEVRGKEAYSLFQAMATGHTSYATVHASTIHTLIQRLENPPISLPRALLTSLDMIVFQNAVDIGGKMVRRMTSITEVIKLDPDTNQLIFMEPFNWVSKTDDRFDSSGSSKILNTIRLQNDWSEEQLNEELEHRKLILEWMDKKDLRDYQKVGKIVSEYQKYPKVLIERARRELST